MARNSVRLNRAGVSEILKSADMHRAVQDLAEKVAQNINNGGYTAESAGKDSPAELHAEVEMSTTDRARASVRVNHPAALAMQARHGMFTKAASAAGLQVRGK